jgi:hypothetical protein
MKTRMAILTAGAALALAGPAAHAGAAIPADGGNTGPGAALVRTPQTAGKQPAAAQRAKAIRAARLLHNPGLPAWIP